MADFTLQSLAPRQLRQGQQLSQAGLSLYSNLKPMDHTKSPQFGRFDPISISQGINNTLKSDFFSQTKLPWGASMSDLTSRSVMIVGKYIPEQIVAAYTGVRPYETFFRNLWTYVASILLTFMVKNDYWSLNSLLFDRFLEVKKEIKPLTENAGIFEKIGHTLKKGINQLRVDANYYKVLEASGFIHKVPQKDLSSSYWRKIMDGNVVERLLSFQKKLPEEITRVKTVGQELGETLEPIKNWINSLQKDERSPEKQKLINNLNTLKQHGKNLVEEGNKIKDVSWDIDQTIYALKDYSSKNKLTLPDAILNPLKKTMHRLEAIDSKILSHTERKTVAPFISKMIRRINTFSILSTIIMTMLNVVFGTVTMWLTFRYFARLDKEFNQEEYILKTQKKKQRKHYQDLINQKPIERLPARLIPDLKNNNYKDSYLAKPLGKVVPETLNPLQKRSILKTPYSNHLTPTNFSEGGE